MIIITKNNGFKIFFFIYYIIYFLITKYLLLITYKNKTIIKNLIYSNKKKTSSIIKMEKVIYSVLLDNYDLLYNFKKIEGFDYYLFSDIELKDPKNWTILKIPDFVKNMNINIVKKQRFLKLHPHLFFKNYDLSIYLDCNLLMLGDINEFLERLLSPKFSIYFFEHRRRNCIYEEIKEVIKLKKDKQISCLRVNTKYKKEKYPHNLGLSENCLIIRRHNQINCIKLMENWWKEIKEYSQRDQLSLNYVIWKTGIKIKYISQGFSSLYFKQIAHLQKPIKK